MITKKPTTVIDQQVKLVFGNLEAELAFLSHKIKNTPIVKTDKKSIIDRLLSCSLF